MDGGDQPLESAQVGLRNLAVPAEREDQRYVDRVAAGGHLLDRRDAGVGGGNLDQQVRSRDCVVEVCRLGDRRLGVAGERGFDLDRDVAVAGLRSLPDGPQKIAGGRDVAESEAEEDALGVAFAAGADLFVVGVPARERLLENARVGGDADDGVLSDSLRECAGFDQVARQVVDPDALAERRQLMQT